MFKGNNKFITLFVILVLWGIIIISVYKVPQLSVFQEYNQDVEPKTANDVWGDERDVFDFEEIPVETPYPTNDGDIFLKEDDSPCGKFQCFTHKEFLEIFDRFELEQSQLTFSRPYIYNHTEADEYIRGFAENRGYQVRGVAPNDTIIAFENVTTLREVRDAYIGMRNAMKQAGSGNLHFVSGYRHPDRQRTIFTNKLPGVIVGDIPTGIYDDVLDNVLNTSSIPGYSKHHTGYAADFGCGNDALVYEFAHTSCYRWLSENNFENAKRFGFIPSYPEGVEQQGPLPEPWEFVWVGKEYLIDDTDVTVF